MTVISNPTRSPLVTPARVALLALLASALILAAAHLLERFGHMVPCPLCLEQREVYWWAMPLALAALVLSRFGRWPMRIGFAVLTLCFAVGIWRAGFHIGVEHGWWTSSCLASAPASVSDLLNQDPTRPIARCDRPAALLGISLASYNLLASIGLAGLASLPLWRHLK